MTKKYIIYDKITGDILRSGHSATPELQYDSNIEDIIFTDHIGQNGWKVDLKTKEIVTCKPKKYIIDVYEALKAGEDDTTIDNIIMDMKDSPDPVQWRKDNYSFFRINSYPPIIDFIDAQVKINSGQKSLEDSGNVELAEYVNKCLAIKQKYPKADTVIKDK